MLKIVVLNIKGINFDTNKRGEQNLLMALGP